MNINIFTRVELLFWNITILALSQSDVARSLVRKLYNLANGSDITSLGLLMATSGVIGLICGYLFYFITLSMR